MTLWDLTAIGPGGTETLDSSNVMTSDVFFIPLLCTNYSHLECIGHKAMKATMAQWINCYLCKSQGVNLEIENLLKVECRVMYFKLD